MASTNLALREKTFRLHRAERPQSDTFTVGGASLKALFLGLLCMFSGGFAMYYLCHSVQDFANVFIPLWLTSSGLTLILSIVTIWVPHWSPFTAPMYAVSHGVALSCSLLFIESYCPGVPRLAGLLTISTFLGMLFLYYTGFIQVANSSYTLGLVMGISLLLSSLVYNLLISFGYINEWLTINTINIGFSLAFIVYFAYGLLLDFDQIQRGEHLGAAKYMEWYCGFALLHTTIAIYMQFVKLLIELQKRSNQRRS